ncbi:hydrogenase maturation nickel metallochaperone HypA [Schleiferiaceae bacterium]|nr:hydrogenase maturation nickel metallochaperone HypA [Schleiferiaceae bacterium]
MKYSCKDCGHEFEGNDFTTECESCNSSNIQVSSKGNSKLPWNKVLPIIGGIVLLIMLLKTCGKDSERSDLEENVIVVVEFQQDKTYGWKVTAEKRSSQGGIDPFNLNGIEKIFNNTAKKEVEFDNVSGQLYLCYEDTIPSEFKFYFKNLQFSSKPIKRKLSLRGVPDGKAKCPINASWSDFTCATNPDDCAISIKVKKSSADRQSQIEDGGIWISVNGKNGSYSKRSSWNPIQEKLAKWDVWIVCNEKNDTIQVYDGMRTGQKYSCKLPMDPKTRQALENKINKQFNTFTTDCTNKKLLKALNNSISGLKVIGEIDGLGKMDWGDVYTAIIAKCPQKYKLVAPIKISSDGKSAEIRIRKIE